MPEEWIPSITTVTGARSAAILIRSNVWNKYRYPDSPGNWAFSTYNYDGTGGVPRPPGCGGRFNYWPGAGAKYAYVNSDRMRKAVDYTYGLYIADGYDVAFPAWGSPPYSNVIPDTSSCTGNFSDCIVAAYGNSPSYYPSPLALEGSAGDPKPRHGPIFGAWIGNNTDEANRRIGQPVDNGGTEWAHRWGNGWAQDFIGGSDGSGALMQPDFASGFAYWVYGDVWNYYAYTAGGAVQWLGYPRNNRSPSPFGQCPNSAYQEFEKGYIIINCAGSTGAFGYNKTFLPLILK